MRRTWLARLTEDATAAARAEELRLAAVGVGVVEPHESHGVERREQRRDETDGALLVLLGTAGRLG